MIDFIAKKIRGFICVTDIAWFVIFILNLNGLFGLFQVNLHGLMIMLDSQRYFIFILSIMWKILSFLKVYTFLFFMICFHAVENLLTIVSFKNDQGTSVNIKETWARL